jgi:erythromycin esterase-like protein
MRIPGQIGHHLTEMFGEDLVIFGTATGEGTYTAARGTGLGSNPLVSPPLGSAEALLAKADLPLLVLDARDAFFDDPASAWLTRETPFRTLGALAMTAQFQPRRLADLLDLLVYVEESSASRLLER